MSSGESHMTEHDFDAACARAAGKAKKGRQSLPQASSRPTDGRAVAQLRAKRQGSGFTARWDDNTSGCGHAGLGFKGAEIFGQNSGPGCRLGTIALPGGSDQSLFCGLRRLKQLIGCDKVRSDFKDLVVVRAGWSPLSRVAHGSHGGACGHGPETQTCARCLYLQGIGRGPD